MPMLRLDKISLAYGHRALLEGVDFEIDKGERVCLVGRNGEGKSSLLRVISGSAEADDGEVWHLDSLRISHLEQEVPADDHATIYEVVSAGLGEIGELLTRYHNATHHVSQADEIRQEEILPEEIPLDELADLQHRIELLDGWNISQKVETVLSKLSLPADKRIADCSGGVRRRVMLAQALVSDPQLLLLDEPTNHMDIAAITWLEEYLLAYQGALIFITHDRTFLRHLATRIIELDRGKLTSFPGNYGYYLRKKEELLEIEQRANARFDKKLAEEEAWIRKGIKARRTRNEGRVRALQDLRKERSQRVEQQGKASLAVESADISGKLVVDLRHVSFGYGDHTIIRDFSTRILRGDRIGIIGPNGSGKSTLLKLILGELEPDSGEVVRGTRLELAYFDQQRAQLDVNKTVRDNVSEGSDFISVKGRSRHVISYLKDFLFPPERIDSPVKVLSGGERNRLLLAKMFTQSCNMMVLDEPTNDLDVDTLELLEDLLMEFDGTLLLVSHDRTFLDNVVTSTIVFEADGQVGEYVGGYEDWIRQRRQPVSFEKIVSDTRETKQAPASKSAGRTQKLGYKDKRELKALPARIEALETEQSELQSRMSDSAFYQQEKDKIAATLARMEEVTSELDMCFARWELLEGQQ